MLRHYLPHLTFFTVFFLAAVPVLYYIQRKNPNPRFRPHFGEMSLFTLIAACICGAMAIGLGSLFKPENDGRAMTKKPSFESPSSGGGQDAGAGRSNKKDNNRKSDDGDEPPRRSLHDRL